MDRPPWEMTRFQYFRSITHYSYENGCAFPTYYITKEPRRPFVFQQAWDHCGYHREYGHFWILTRQVEQSGHVDCISVENWLEYQDAWKKFFRENAQLQLPEAVGFRDGCRITCPHAVLGRKPRTEF